MKRILCVGKDATLLRTRCAVLLYSGYDAGSVLYENAEEILIRKQFDLIILSLSLDDDEKSHILARVDEAIPILSLQTVLSAPELLMKVQQRLEPFRRRNRQVGVARQKPRSKADPLLASAVLLNAIDPHRAEGPEARPAAELPRALQLDRRRR